MRTQDESDIPEIEALLPLALSQPTAALTTARRLLDGGAAAPDAHTVSIAHQALGIVERDRGHLPAALRHLRLALAAARRCESTRVADVLATYGLTLVHAGRAAEGLRRLDEALPLTPHSGMPRLLLRRAQGLYVLGHYGEAAAVIEDAVAGSRRDGDTLWEARGLSNRSVILLALGRTDAAATDATRAGTLFAELDQGMEHAQTLQNRGWAAFQGGDVPDALTLMDRAAAQERDLGIADPTLVIDRARALVTAGLAQEALDLVRDTLAQGSVSPVQRAELVMVAAYASLTLDPAAAAALAERVRRQFAGQRRGRLADQAQLLAVQARLALAERAAAPRDRLRRLAATMDTLLERLRADRSPDLPSALLVQATIARRLGRPPAITTPLLEEAASTRHTGAPLSRAAGWLAAAYLADGRGDRRALRQACGRGLDAVDEHRALLGDLELRALASQHGLRLAELAVDDAATSGTPRDLLRWSERWRATGLTAVVRPPRDTVLERDIAALRDVSRRLAVGDEPGQEVLRRERTRLERAVRGRYRRLQGAGQVRHGVDIAALVRSSLETDTTVVSLVVAAQSLYALVVAGGRVTRVRLGDYAAALKETDYARFTLRRAAFGRRVDLVATGRRLERALLADAAPQLARAGGWSGRPGARVVVVPPAGLLVAPFGLLPTFSDAVVTVAPSASLWLRAREALAHTDAAVPEPSTTRVALVCGPGLRAGEEEVAAVKAVHDTADTAETAVTVHTLQGADATVDAVLQLIDGTRIAHLVAHGTFRADAPLFSSLALHDGPLTVHDFDRLERAPELVVLSACDLGSSGAVGADEALGLVSSLLAVGSRSVLACVVPVNDVATCSVMREVHRVLAAGGTPAEGLSAARQAAADPLTAATAAAFTVWGG